MNRCIIVQGPTYGHSINQIKECWKGWPVIYSTWKGDERYYTSDDIVVFSHLPATKGTSNMNYQKHSTIAGLNLAKEMGYERALKMRSDMWVNNPHKFFETLSDGYNTLFWYGDTNGYLSDYWMEDTIDNLLTLWDVRVEGAFPERLLTDRIKELGWMDRVHLKLSEINEDNDVYWNSRYEAYWQHNLKNEEIYKTKIYG